MVKNNELYLEEPTINRKQEAQKYIEEFKKYNENYSGIGKLKEIENKLTYEEYLKYLDNMKNEEYAKKHNDVPQTTYFLIRKKDNKIIGITNLKHYLNEELLECGGHIGYGIRPSERGKGYGTIFLHLLLQKCKELGIKEVMLVCKVDNFGSQRVIENNLGSYIDTVLDSCDNEYYKRYNIDVEKSLELYKNEKQHKINHLKKR